MKKIGIICAIERELAPYIRDIQNAKSTSEAMLTFHEGYIGGVEVVAVYGGVCKVNAAIATQLLITQHKVDRVIVSGVAGGIDPRLKIGDSVIATEVCYHDVAEGILTGYHPYMADAYFRPDPALLDRCRETLCAAGQHKTYYGRIVTGEAFIDVDGREDIIERFNPLCVDMETASIAHVCYVNRTPFLAVRSISDTPQESGMSTFDENCDYAAAQSYHLVKQLLEWVK